MFNVISEKQEDLVENNDEDKRGGWWWWWNGQFCFFCLFDSPKFTPSSTTPRGLCVWFTNTCSSINYILRFMYLSHQHLLLHQLYPEVYVFDSPTPAPPSTILWGLCVWFTNTCSSINYTLRFVCLIQQHLLLHQLYPGVYVFDSTTPVPPSTILRGLCVWFTNTCSSNNYTLRFMCLIHQHLFLHHLYSEVYMFDSTTPVPPSTTPWGLCVWFTNTCSSINYTLRFLCLIHQHLFLHHLHSEVYMFDSTTPVPPSTTPWGLYVWFTNTCSSIDYTKRVMCLIHQHLFLHHLHSEVYMFDSTTPVPPSTTPWGLCVWFTNTFSFINYTQRFICLIHQHLFLHQLLPEVYCWLHQLSDHLVFFRLFFSEFQSVKFIKTSFFSNFFVSRKVSHWTIRRNQWLTSKNRDKQGQGWWVSFESVLYQNKNWK